MLIELGLMQQRHQAVLEVLAGQTVTAVARRFARPQHTARDECFIDTRRVSVLRCVALSGAAPPTA